jgi:hypothetical protein
MAKCFRLAAILVALPLTALTVALLQPEWSRDLGLEGLPRIFPDSKPSPPCRTAAEMKRTVCAIDRRIDEKDRLANELIDGRLTLFEAAAHFRRLNDGGSKFAAPLSMFYPGDSEEERLCRQAISYAQHCLNQRRVGDRAADEFAARCEEELCRHKERHGAVVLPDLIDRGCSSPPVNR